VPGADSGGCGVVVIGSRRRVPRVRCDQGADSGSETGDALDRQDEQQQPPGGRPAAPETPPGRRQTSWPPPAGSSRVAGGDR
jgi:hypothetical protein